MYAILDESSEDVIGIKVTGKLSAEDFKQLASRIEAAIERSSGKIRLLSDLRAFSGMDMAAFWEDLTFSLKHVCDFDRVAVVGDQKWIEWWTKGMNPLVKAEARHFPSDEIDSAWSWLRDGA